MEGDANDAFRMPPSAYAKKFTGKYEHRTLTGALATTCCRQRYKLSHRL